MLQRIQQSASNRAHLLWDRIDGRDIYDKVRLRPENEDIRLLRLEGDSIPASGPLRCRFEILSLKSIESGGDEQSAAGLDGRTSRWRKENSCERPTYSAVSYTWGRNPATTLMIIQGRSIQVPANTEIAARNLLAHKIREATESPGATGVEHHKSQTAYLWIDALCINQQDLHEKSWQVALMGRIYSSAYEVLVWLGEAHKDECWKLKELLEDVYKDCERATDNFSNLRETLDSNRTTGPDIVLPGTQLSQPQPHIVETSLFTEDKWNLVTNFYSLGWFSRVWIIQEIALASRATLYWGEASFSWPTASVAASWIYHGRMGLAFLGSEQLTLASARTVRRLEKVLQLHGRSAQAQPTFPGAKQSECTLSSVLFGSSNFNATDPRDNVFALLGLLSPQARKMSAAYVAPDYSSDLATVYTAATRALIDQCKSVALINQAGLHQASQPGAERPLPSWVPHWGQAGRGLNGSCRQLYVKVDKYTFTPPLVLREISGSPQILSVKGISVDMVDRLGPSFSVPGSMPDSDDATKIKILQELARQVTRAHAFARTSSTSTAEYISGFEEAFLITLFCGCTAHNERADQDAEFLPSAEALLQCFENFAADTIIPRHAAREVHPLNQFCHNRTFFITSNGRFGMAPPGTQEGDHVVCLTSHSWPFVLRQVGEHWVLLGDVYVDGLMSGSHWRDLDQDDAIWMAIH